MTALVRLVSYYAVKTALLMNIRVTFRYNADIGKIGTYLHTYIADLTICNNMQQYLTLFNNI